MAIFRGKRKIYAVVLLVLAAVLLFLFRGELFNLYQDFYPELAKVSKTTYENLKELESKVRMPEPGVVAEKGPSGNLTQSGVITLTNDERSKTGAPALKENTKLDEAAKLKAEDMFKKQYFEHVSPTGVGPSDLAKEVDYQYIYLGENLALGDFADDGALLAAWMASPGHRANILDSAYRDIGVAVVKGEYQGEETWIAVQEFGTPQSYCPLPSSSLKTEIQSEENSLTDLSKQISNLANQITTSRGGRGERSQQVKDYNNLVDQYNNLLNDVKNKISEYNSEVQKYNDCVNGL